jgi:maltose alpha-D-glucosyltransferase/alpha-amylase
MEETAEIEPRARDLEQSNSTVVYSNRWILKLFRRVEPGLNPELDIGRFLASKKHSGTPALAGALEYATTRGEPATLGVVHEFVAEAKDAWAHTLDVLGRYFERVLSLPAGMRAVTKSPAPLSELVAGPIPEQVSELLGTYVETARLLGKRTAELHAALASEDEDPRFRPEPFTLHYQRSLYQNLRALAVRILGQLRASAPKLPEALRPLANEVGGLEEACLARFHLISGAKIDALRIRCHGDFHLGQVLYTGKDFLIIDFEGEPARSLGERTIKRPALRDVAGMLRSFHYASRTALEKEVELGKLDRSNLADAEPWARFWQSWAGALYLKAYFEAALDSRFLPKRRQDTWLLLDAFTLEKALYEIGYELDNRPGWVHIPLEGVLRLLGK